MYCLYCCRYSEGLEFVKGLSRREAAAALQKYGKVGAPVVPSLAHVLAPHLWIEKHLFNKATTLCPRPRASPAQPPTSTDHLPPIPARPSLFTRLSFLLWAPTAGPSGARAG